MAVNTTSGAKLFIGTTAPATNQTQFAADTYTEVKEVGTLGTFGDTSQTVTWESIGDARVRKYKGSRDAGNMQVTCGRDPGDAGQNAMRAAQLTIYDYNFKLVLNDQPAGGTTPSTFYFRAKVMAAPLNLGGNNDISRNEFTLGINSSIIEIPAV